ncbi:MAG: helix-turn-helix domain-containing protein [Prochloraceae cyanobacterium]
MTNACMKVKMTIEVEVPGLGKKIEEARRSDKRPLTQICEKVDLTTMYWYQIEREEVKALPLETLRKIEKILNIDFGVKFERYQEQTESKLSKEEVIELVSKLKQTIESSQLVDKEKRKIIAYLSPIIEEIKEDKPDKKAVKLTLEGITHKINQLSYTLDTATRLWQKAEPILNQIQYWVELQDNLSTYKYN